MAPIRSAPGESRPPVRAGLVLPVVVMAASVVTAVSVVAPAARVAVAVCGAVAVLAVAGLAAEAGRCGRRVAEVQMRHAEWDARLRRQLADQDAQIVLLADVLLPEAMDRLRQGETVDEVLDALRGRDGSGPAFHPAHLAMLRRVLGAVKAEEDLRESAQRAFVNIARRVQAIVHRQFQDLRKMEDRHGAEPEVFGDLLHLDHGTALIGRLADSIAVLGGSRPGRQWQQNVPLFNVLRGAISRIADYQRVDLHSVVEVAVVGPAVEPLIHALAEILDNATRYSPPHTRVHLTAIEVPSGIAVEVEDGGVGLTEEARTRAEQVLSHVSSGLDLADLGETPRLGLSVVGRLAQANGFQVALRPSAYAGVRAVLVIPSELVTTVPVATGPATAAAIPGAGVFGAGPSVPAARSREPKYAVNGIGLPQRQRRGPVAVAGLAGPDAAPTPAAAPDVAVQAGPTVLSGEAGEPADQVEPGLWLAAFQNGAHDEESSVSPSSAGDELSSDEGN